MSHYVLYAYVDGSDLHGVEADVERHIQGFIESSTWHLDKAWLVNQRREDDPSLGPDDLPDWQLGLNVKLQAPESAPANWFDDIEHIVRFLGQLHEETNRDFVVGVGDTTRPWFSDDLLFVDRRNPDLTHLRRILGADRGAT
jgi:hypothetical protein